ncbi:MAG: hypothetical protein ABR595_01425 [Psychroflexus sp.]
MNYNLLKKGYFTLLALMLLVASIFLLFTEQITEFIPAKYILGLLLILMITSLVLKGLHEVKYPVPVWRKKVGYIITFILFIGLIFQLVNDFIS